MRKYFAVLLLALFAGTTTYAQASMKSVEAKLDKGGVYYAIGRPAHMFSNLVTQYEKMHKSITAQMREMGNQEAAMMLTMADMVIREIGIASGFANIEVFGESALESGEFNGETLYVRRSVAKIAKSEKPTLLSALATGGKYTVKDIEELPEDTVAAGVATLPFNGIFEASKRVSVVPMGLIAINELCQNATGMSVAELVDALTTTVLFAALAPEDITITGSGTVVNVNPMMIRFTDKDNRIAGALTSALPFENGCFEPDANVTLLLEEGFFYLYIGDSRAKFEAARSGSAPRLSASPAFAKLKTSKALPKTAAAISYINSSGLMIVAEDVGGSAALLPAGDGYNFIALGTVNFDGTMYTDISVGTIRPMGFEYLTNGVAHLVAVFAEIINNAPEGE